MSLAVQESRDFDTNGPFLDLVWTRVVIEHVLKPPGCKLKVRFWRKSKRKSVVWISKREISIVLFVQEVVKIFEVNYIISDKSNPQAYPD